MPQIGYHGLKHEYPDLDLTYAQVAALVRFGADPLAAIMNMETQINEKYRPEHRGAVTAHLRRWAEYLAFERKAAYANVGECEPAGGVYDGK